MTKSRSTTVLAAVLALNAGAANAASLTILHNNDGESKLLPETLTNTSGVDESFGGAARFVSLVNEIKADRTSTPGQSVLTLSSGDNILPGNVFNESLNNVLLNGAPFYDAQVLNAIGYDAIALGNHDFDLGPDVLADFVGDVNAPYVSANLDFSGHAPLQARFDAGEIVKSTIVEQNGEQFGIIGATTTDLASISSPGPVQTTDIVPALQAEIAALEAQDVNKIILISHLQDFGQDEQVIGQLTGIDIAISGGGSEFQANAGDALNSTPELPYPAVVQDQAGNDVLVVTTAGDYRYLGVLDVEFDDAGVIIPGSVSSTSGPQLIRDSITPDATIQSTVIDPVSQALAAQATTPIGATEVGLNGIRADVRSKQTNLGSLLTDSYIFTAQKIDAERGGTLLNGDALVALTNGGGIRNNSIIAPGTLFADAPTDIAPFGNSLVVVSGVTAADLLVILENAVSTVDTGESQGRFAQVSGMRFAYDSALDPGERILSISLEDGTLLYNRSSGFLDDMFELDLVTIDFLTAEAGRDGYDFTIFDQVELFTTYDRSFFNFLTTPENEGGLGGTVLAAQYAQSLADARIAEISEPVTAGLFGLGLIGLGLRSRRKHA